MQTDLENMDKKIEKMKEKLLAVSDSYEGFIKAVLNYADKSERRYRVVSKYLAEHPRALSSDILEYISEQEDFYDEFIEQYMKVGNMKELIEKLRNVPDSYSAFVGGIMRYASTDRLRKEKVLKYMNEHPAAKTSDIVKFVMEQDDFHEAAQSTRNRIMEINDMGTMSQNGGNEV